MNSRKAYLGFSRTSIIGWMILTLILPWDLPAWSRQVGIVGAPGDGAADDAFTPDELDELVGPIALFPDVLIAHILPAATQPLEIVQAARILADAGGSVDAEVIRNLSFEVSVLALMHYPEVIELLNDDLDWTSTLGDAVVLQKGDVMDAIQHFRAQAEAAGNLLTNEHMTVTREVVIVQSPTVIEREVIVIQPTNPQVIFIPRYDPATVIVVQRRPAPVITFGTGLALGAWMGYALSWNSRTIRVDVRHRNYWAVVRPGWGAVNHWRPASVGGVARRTARRTTRRVNRRHDAWANRPAAAPGVPGGAIGGRRPGAGATEGARPSAGAGARPGERVGQRPGERMRPETGGRPGDRAPATGGTRLGDRAGTTGGQRPGDRAPATGGTRLGDRAGTAGGQRAGDLAGAAPNRGQSRPASAPSRPFGGYQSGRATQRQSDRGAVSRGVQPGPGGGERNRGGVLDGRRR